MTAPTPDPRRVRVRVGVGAAMILLLAGLAVAVLLVAITPHGSSAIVRPSPATPSAPDMPVGQVIYVHILGQVAHPGLYALRDGDRGVDAIAAAGGFTPDANQAGINLARFLSDGEQIVVPAIGEIVAGNGSGGSDGLVNLNTADAAALETLPRIGPALAERILAWRERNGRFTSADDLLDVPGIGSATLDGLRDLVSV